MFERNSARCEVEDGADPPDLGDDDTPLAEVEAFYSWWTRSETKQTFELAAAMAAIIQAKECGHEESRDRQDSREFQAIMDKALKKLKKKESGEACATLIHSTSSLRS